MNNVRLLKTIPENRLQLITGDVNVPPAPGDLGVTDQCYSDLGGPMVLVYFVSKNGETEWEASAYESEIEPTISSAMELSELIDASNWYRNGETPWTIFAYPTSSARSNGLPPDYEVLALFAELQKCGVSLGIWVDGIGENTTYIACPFSGRVQVDRTVAALEAMGVIEKNFLSEHSNRLFAS